MSEAPVGTPSDEGIRKLGYVPSFDGLRGVGAVFVVVVHLVMIVIPDGRNLPGFIPGTFVFMDMFFVLSGFLITALLLREQEKTGGVSLIGFYRRRALRLLPALYVLLVVHVLYAWIVGLDMQVEWDTVIAAAFYFLNFKMKTMLSPVADGLTQLWSLSMEEQFYLVWPIVVIVLVPLRRPLKIVVPVLVGAIAFVAIRRAILWNDGAEWLRIYTHTDTRADSLLLGALVAHLWVRRKTPTRFLAPAAWASTALLVWFVAFVTLESSFPALGGYNLMSFAWSIVILTSLERKWGMSRLLELKPMRILGDVSYGVYLWHVPVQVAIARHGASWPMPVRVLVSTGLLAVIVWASWVFIEKPALRWKSRLEHPRPKPVIEHEGTVWGSGPTDAPADGVAEGRRGV